jgi:hypothetical protein
VHGEALGGQAHFQAAVVARDLGLGRLPVGKVLRLLLLLLPPTGGARGRSRRSPGLLEPTQVGQIFTEGSGGPHHQRAA